MVKYNPQNVVINTQIASCFVHLENKFGFKNTLKQSGASGRDVNSSI